MKDLSLRAKVYILSMILVGLVLLVWGFSKLLRQDMLMLIALSSLASISLIFKVTGATERSHYNISFVIYGFAFVLLGPEATLFVVLISNIVEWAWHRYPWYIQCFNIASYCIGFSAAGLVFDWINPGDHFFGLQAVLGVLAALAVFTFINHLTVGVVIWLARGENFAQSGIFDVFPLMLDFILLAMGAGVAFIWQVTPAAALLVLLPLYLIYTTLKVPALERKSETDPKTGLFNAEYFKRTLEAELERANRFERPLTVVMADLDLLRNINNTYGHLAGDEVLIGVANIIQQAAREFDVVARFGGEEYAILMPEATPLQVYDRIEAIRLKIENAEFSVATSITPIKATMSFGLSGRVEGEPTYQELIHNADAALYHAKLRGRNGSIIYSEEGLVDFFNGERSTHHDLERAALIEDQDSDMTPEEENQSSESPEDPSQGGEPMAKDSEQDAQRAKTQPMWVVYSFIGLLLIAALFLFRITFTPDREQDWLGLFIFAILVIFTEWFSIDIYVRDSAVSTSAVPIMAGILIYGPIGALGLSMVFAVVAGIKHRSPLNRFVFNFSNQTIAGLIYSGLLVATGNTYIRLDPFAQLAFSVFASGIVYMSTTSMIAVGMSLNLGIPAKWIWMEKFRWLAPYYFGMGVIVYILVYSYQMAGVLGIIAVLVPLLILRFSQKQYIERTKNVVNELKKKNQALERSAVEINKLNEGLLNTLAEVVDLRDPFVLGHSKQVARYAVMMGKNLGLSPERLELLRKAALLHDIGKLGVPERILFKPGKLTPDEYEKIKAHVDLGADILQASHVLKDLIPIVRHHHENYDGNGYPGGLAGEAIPFEARILAVADAVEAMGSDRPYRRGMTQDEVLQELMDQAGAQFDPAVVKAFQTLSEQKTEPVVINFSRALRPSKLAPVEVGYVAASAD